MPDHVTASTAAPVVTMGTFNFEHGGRRDDGTFDLAPAIAHIAAQVPRIDLLALQEVKGYGRDGGRILHEFAGRLRASVGGTWGAHLAVSPISGAHNAVFYRTETFRVVQAYADVAAADDRLALAGSLWLAVDGLEVPLVVHSVHWRHDSGEARIQEAKLLGNLITRAAIVAGDFNCVWPGDPSFELRPVWENLPPHLRSHKTVADPATGRLESDLGAGLVCQRHGWVDAGALAKDGTVTTNATSDRAPCRIDRIMASPPLAAGIIEGSYTVHVPPGDPVSDHRMVSVRIDLSRFDQPFSAPWWADAGFGAWRWGGGDRSQNPNTHTGWVRA